VIAVLLVGLAALATAPVTSTLAPAGQSSPVRVDAAQVHYQFQRREVIFSGKPVTLTRDDAVLTCARLVAKNDEAGQIVTATCRGDVKLVRGERIVTCDTATYENAEARVTCEGNTVLRDRGTEAHGVRLVYDLRADDVQLDGGPEQAPVRITIPGAEAEQRQRAFESQRKPRPRKEAQR
jgi:lipopolysaccharide export system protein LptA